MGAVPTTSTNLNGVEEEQQTHFPVTEKIVGAAPIYLAILNIIMTYGEVKQAYKQDIFCIKQNPKEFFLMFIRQSEQFRDWEYQWLKITLSLCKLCIKRFYFILRFWVVCILNGYFPWEIPKE